MKETFGKEITRIYENRRLAAIEKQEQRKAALYLQYPEFEQLEYQIKLLGVKMSKAILSGSKEETQAVLAEMHTLKERKKVFLSQNHISEKALSIDYICPKCQDRGFITVNTRSERCTCYRSLIVDLLYKDFTLDPNRKMTFEKFQIEYYPDRISKERYGIDQSPRDKMKQNYNICRKFVEQFEASSSKNLLLFGSSGVGKTFMCGCIANALMGKGIPVLYLSATDMFHIITAARMGKLSAGEEQTKIEDLIQTELLIIDDLGTENLTESRCSEFLEILNKKKGINESRPCRIVISTNLTLSEIVARYSERIGSRILSEFTYCRFVGDDIRMIDR